MFIFKLLICWCIFVHRVDAVIDITVTDEESRLFLLSDIGPYEHSVTSVTFQVRGCRDAIFLLSSQTSPLPPNYYIIIGGWGNKKSILGRNISDYVEVDEYKSSEMSCIHWRDFWVTFNQRLVQIGKGSDVGENAFLTYQEECPFQLQSIELTTLSDGHSNTVAWKLLSTGQTIKPTIIQSPVVRHFRKSISCPTFEVSCTTRTATSWSCATECSINPMCQGYMYSTESMLCECVSKTALHNSASMYLIMQPIN